MIGYNNRYCNTKAVENNFQCINTNIDNNNNKIGTINENDYDDDETSTISSSSSSSDYDYSESIDEEEGYYVYNACKMMPATTRKQLPQHHHSSHPHPHQSFINKTTTTTPTLSSNGAIPKYVIIPRSVSPCNTITGPSITSATAATAARFNTGLNQTTRRTTNGQDCYYYSSASSENDYNYADYYGYEDCYPNKQRYSSSSSSSYDNHYNESARKSSSSSLAIEKMLMKRNAAKIQAEYKISLHCLTKRMIQSNETTQLIKRQRLMYNNKKNNNNNNFTESSRFRNTTTFMDHHDLSIIHQPLFYTPTPTTTKTSTNNTRKGDEHGVEYTRRKIYDLIQSSLLSI